MTAVPQPLADQPAADTAAADTVEATFDREVRLGLVLYGGVSLAVYINGVAQEFFNAVKGRGAYSLLKCLIGSDIVVDIVSGTSAGGINGVLLSHCLANDLEFGAFASLWKKHGDLQKLMNGIDVAEPTSLLDGEGYFQGRLESALADLPNYRAERTIASRVEALDLFVTSTDFYGDLSTRLDDLGSMIEVKDHRRVFKLRFRKNTLHDFTSPRALVQKHRRALATICRSTATFPGAFAPVEVPADERDEDAPVSDWFHYLHNWAGKKSGERMVLIDGGVIDNKPFSHTIRDIYARTADREVNRKLFFVEPDPEHFAPPPAEGVPDFLGVVSASLSGLPSYESIADDLRSIDDRNRQLANYDALVGKLRARLQKQGYVDTPTTVQRELYLDSRLEDFGERFVTAVLGGERSHRARADEVHQTAKELLRWFQNFGRQTAQRSPATNPGGGSVPGTSAPASVAPASVAPATGAATVASSAPSATGTSSPGVVVAVETPEEAEARARREEEAQRADFLNRFDIDFRIRRLFHVSYYLYDLAYVRSEVPVHDDERRAAENLLAAINRWIQVFKCVQAAELELRSALWENAELASRLGKRTALEVWKDVLLLVDGFFNPLLAVDGWISGLGACPAPTDKTGRWAKYLPESEIRGEASTSLQSILRAAVVAKATLPTPSAPQPQPLTLLQRFDDQINKLIDDFEKRPKPDHPGEFEYPLGSAGATIGLAWRRFEDIDTTLFPFEFLSSLREKDRIDVVRISPKDAALGLCNRAPYEKVCGETLGHFGAFLKQSWRGNDILWGRLDTVTLLFQALLPRERLQEVVASPKGRLRVKEQLYRCAGLDPKPLAAVERVGKPPEERDEVVEVAGAFDAKRVVAHFFPEDHGAPRDGLVRWLTDLLDVAPKSVAPKDAGKARIAALAPSAFIKARTELIELCQHDVVASDVQGVVEDAIEQSRAWGTLPGAARGEQNGSFDALVGGYASTVMSELAATGKKYPELKNPVEFFKKTYSVGSESPAEDIPPLVLLRLVAQVALVMEGVLKASLKQALPSALYTVVTPVTYAIRLVGYVAYGFAQASRVSRLRHLLFFGMLGVFALGIIYSQWWYEAPTAKSPAKIAFVQFGLLIVVPLLWAVFEGSLFFRTQRQAVGWLILTLGLSFTGLAVGLGWYRSWQKIGHQAAIGVSELGATDWLIVLAPLLALLALVLVRVLGVPPRKAPKKKQCCDHDCKAVNRATVRAAKSIKRVPAPLRADYLEGLVSAARDEQGQSDASALKERARRAGVRESHLAAFVANAWRPSWNSKSIETWLRAKDDGIQAEEEQRAVLKLAQAKKAKCQALIEVLDDPTGDLALGKDLKLTHASLKEATMKSESEALVQELVWTAIVEMAKRDGSNE